MVFTIQNCFEADVLRGGYYDVFAMAYGLLALDIILRLALIEKKVAARWLPQEEENKDETVADAVQPITSPKSPLDSKQYPDESLVQEKPARTTTEPKKGWTSRLPPVVTLLASRRLDAALFGCLVQAALLTSFDSILPLYMRDIFGWNSIGAGLIFLPLTIPSFCGPLIGWVSDKYGCRWPATIGFVLAVPPLILLRLVKHDSMGQKVLICALLAVIGFTLTIVLVPIMAEITYAVEAKAAKLPPGSFGKGGAVAQGYGLFNMAFAGGSLAGPLLAGLVRERAGWGTTTLVLGCVSAFAAVPTLIWGGGSIFKERRAKRASQDVEQSVEQT